MPSYKTCVEVAELSALRRVSIPVGFALLAPIALGIGLRLMYRSEGPGLVAESLASFVVMASLTGLGAALAIDGARAALGKVRRAIRPRDGSAGFSASVSADALADILGNAAGPAAQLLVKAAAVTALAMTPLLF
jgi:Na+/H+-translocating membrane pyrophosphatase